MSILIESAACDIVLGYLAHVGRNPRHYGQLREPLFALRARHPEKMFVVCMLCPPDVREELEAQGLLVFEEPTRAVIAIAAAAAITRGLSRNDEPAAAARPVDLPRRKLNETEAKDVLRQAGIATLPERVVRSGDEARRVAAAMETPVAMKIVSAQVAHKSDVGGVRLNVASADEADRTYDELIAAVGRAAPHAKLDGVLVTPMLQGGVETILGVVRDPVFGPVVMFGSGGVLVELTNDVAFRAAPFGKEVAGEMIDQTLAAKLLRGVRGARPADRDALVRTLTRLADFASTNADRLDSIDINPYVVLPKGGVALDAVVVPRLESQ
jgi:acyl-CoA synthetase (NDP forming)